MPTRSAKAVEFFFLVSGLLSRFLNVILEGRKNDFLQPMPSGNASTGYPVRMTVSLRSELLFEPDEFCSENRCKRFEFLRAGFEYLLEASPGIQSTKIEAPNEEALTA